MAQTQQQQQQSSSHLGSVARRHGGEEANQNTGSSTNNVVAVPGQHTAEPGSSEVRGGNGVVLPEPPETAKHPVVDTLYGDTITDEYRWLEKQRDPETRAWITAQNAYTDLIRGMVHVFRSALPNGRDAGRRAETMVSLCVGGMVLARTTNDATMRKSLRSAARHQALQLLDADRLPKLKL